jgi:tetratricopeptide (TPR) repeat protein
MRALVLALALALAAPVAFVGGCAKGHGNDAPVVDTALLAFLSKARAAHHEADIIESSGDVAKAIAPLEALVRGPRPATGGSALPPEAAEVLADTHARLADLRSKIGDFAAAQRDVEQGLVLAVTPTHFRGHLFEVQGVVLERQAKALESSGDAAGAQRVKAKAVDAFETAIKIQDQVIQEALSGRGR